MEEQKIPFSEAAARFGISKRQALAFRRNPMGLTMGSIHSICRGLGMPIRDIDLVEQSFHDKAFEVPVVNYASYTAGHRDVCAHERVSLTEAVLNDADPLH